ncbi:hypothetical protein ACRAWD_04295 [Caulobacter segnis]
MCIFCAAAQLDDYGYTTVVHGYDGRGTVGVLAKRMKARGYTFFRIPQGTRHSLQQWAAFSLRHMTAWSNWKVALELIACRSPRPKIRVRAFGGWAGTTLAQLDLARRAGCDAIVISGSDHHLDEIAKRGITAVDRRQFPDLNHDPAEDQDLTRRMAYSAPSAPS